jgi:hypothetical protein
MTINDEDFFSAKHNRLVRVSETANLFAWIILVFFVLEGILYGVIKYSNLPVQLGFLSIVEMFKENPVSAIHYFLVAINIMLKGVVYWLTLKGVSLGLNMIVETDLNYRERLQGESHG